MDLPRYHRLTAPYYRLEGQRCAACGAVQFPPRPACGACRSADLATYRFSGRGTVYSFAEVSQAPKGFSGPYVVAMVELEEGVRVTAQLTDVEPEDVEIGMPVEMVTRRIQEKGPQGYLVYGYKFRPVLQASSQIEQRKAS
ncbi:MAG TPA: Zn-ribbon domain-containing OB-fold protein [Thermoanaerobaculia bacterium]|nr:Zn-ribbon domain-containing OB-fold protein [Thermoanaerobaculia bacterium]